MDGWTYVRDAFEADMLQVGDKVWYLAPDKDKPILVEISAINERGYAYTAWVLGGDA
jgi:hypothetical protein